MNIVEIAQITGVVSIFALFSINFYITVLDYAWRKSGRVAMLWTTVYIFFLFFLRGLSQINVGTTDQLRIISGFSSLIPLLAVVIHLFFTKQIEEHKLIRSGHEI